MTLKGSKLYSIFRLRCPKCHEGKLFTTPNPYHLNKIGDMPENCPTCGQAFSLEPGFYFGAAYVSYALNVGWLITVFLFSVFVLEVNFVHFLIAAAVLLVLLTPVLFRLSRAIWINFFVSYDPKAVSSN